MGCSEFIYIIYIYNLYINILDTIQVNAKTLCCIKMKLNIQKKSTFEIAFDLVKHTSFHQAA